jgi:hypothetical protein
MPELCTERQITSGRVDISRVAVGLSPLGDVWAASAPDLKNPTVTWSCQLWRCPCPIAFRSRGNPCSASAATCMASQERAQRRPLIPAVHETPSSLCETTNSARHGGAASEWEAPCQTQQSTSLMTRYACHDRVDHSSKTSTIREILEIYVPQCDLCRQT